MLTEQEHDRRTETVGGAGDETGSNQGGADNHTGGKTMKRQEVM